MEHFCNTESTIQGEAPIAPFVHAWVADPVASVVPAPDFDNRIRDLVFSDGPAPRPESPIVLGFFSADLARSWSGMASAYDVLLAGHKSWSYIRPETGIP
jgi:hypothetical protein